MCSCAEFDSVLDQLEALSEEAFAGPPPVDLFPLKVPLFFTWGSTESVGARIRETVLLGALSRNLEWACDIFVWAFSGWFGLTLWASIFGWTLHTSFGWSCFFVAAFCMSAMIKSLLWPTQIWVCLSNDVGYFEPDCLVWRTNRESLEDLARRHWSARLYSNIERISDNMVSKFQDLPSEDEKDLRRDKALASFERSWGARRLLYEIVSSTPRYF